MKKFNEKLSDLGRPGARSGRGLEKGRGARAVGFLGLAGAFKAPDFGAHRLDPKAELFEREVIENLTHDMGGRRQRRARPEQIVFVPDHSEKFPDTEKAEKRFYPDHSEIRREFSSLNLYIWPVVAPRDYNCIRRRRRLEKCSFPVMDIG